MKYKFLIIIFFLLFNCQVPKNNFVYESNGFAGSLIDLGIKENTEVSQVALNKKIPSQNIKITNLSNNKSIVISNIIFKKIESEYSIFLNNISLLTPNFFHLLFVYEFLSFLASVVITFGSICLLDTIS